MFIIPTYRNMYYTMTPLSKLGMQTAFYISTYSYDSEFPSQYQFQDYNFTVDVFVSQTSDILFE